MPKNVGIAQTVKENLELFFDTAYRLGYEKKDMLRNAEAALPTRLREIKEMAEKYGVSYASLLCYNAYQPYILPEGCTVYFAAGKASRSGYTIFGKNSDKGSSPELVGEHCFENREINVVSYFKNDDGSHIIGVSAAGTTGLKMGLNSYGVAAGTNYGYTMEAARRQKEKKDVKAADRAQIIRDALCHKTALEAAQYAASRLIATPMGTSGMVQFADAHTVYVIEGSYDCVAVKKYVDTADTRSNYFVTMDKLNEPGNASCFCRYHRSQQLLMPRAGDVCLEDMLAISCDHMNGPNSICKHVNSDNSSSTLSAAIIELNGENPLKSTIHIALGKPCAAWNSPDGHITLTADSAEEDIPVEFRDGTAFKKYAFAPPRQCAE